MSKNRIYARDIISFCSELADCAFESDAKINVELRFREDVSGIIVFFVRDTNFSLFLYEFLSYEENRVTVELCKKLMKDATLLEDYINARSKELV